VRHNAPFDGVRTEFSMANSLQDQLLKAGLVKENDVRKARAGKRRARKGGAKRTPPDPAAVRATTAAERKRERDRQLNQRIEEGRRRKALRMQIRARVRATMLNAAAAEMPYYFERGKRIKRIYVTAEQQGALSARRLAVVGSGASHYLVPIEVANEVRALSDEVFVHVAEPPVPEPQSPSQTDDDPYAAFVVPDDLRW